MEPLRRRSPAAVLLLAVLLSPSCCLCSGSNSNSNSSSSSSTAVVTAAARASRNQRGVNLVNGTLHYTVCVSPAMPQISCDIGGDPAKFTGYQIDVLERALEAGRLPMRNMDDVELVCLEWQPMIDDLAATDGSGRCYMALGIDIMTSYTKLGIKFTQPTLSLGLKILALGKLHSGGQWTMFQAFDGSIWLALVVTIIVVGVIIEVTRKISSLVQEATSAAAVADASAADKAGSLPPAQLGVHAASSNASGSFSRQQISGLDATMDVATDTGTDAGTDAGVDCSTSDGRHFYAITSCDIEAASVPQHQPPHPAGKHKKRPRRLQRVVRAFGLHRGRRLATMTKTGDQVWLTLTTAFQADSGVQPPANLPGRIAYITFAFCMLVLLSLFTANTASIVTTMRLSSSINGRGDLAGKAVGVWEGYSHLLDNTEIRAVPLPWENDEDLQKMKQMLYTGELKALLFDTATAMWLSAYNSSCLIHAVGEPIQQWGSGFAFPVNTSEAVVNSWDAALLELQQGQNTMDTLRAKYLGGEDVCSTAGDDEYQLHFGQVAGLWVLMGVACGLSLGLLLLLYLGRQHQHIRRLTDAALGSSPTHHHDQHRARHHSGLLKMPSKLRKSWTKHHHHHPYSAPPK